ncbi:inositol 2-dehydrogenase [Sinomonas notoginsengisoli]|uniref:inositol 2-dehydrogenase n=1 Tax=Sinomonas notoginsengisoli TaxID=1457311 RepID=UPI001F31885F|nr:inositol 2-dehydrogenase [Sinomonas notoginsengisoli]
MSSERLRVALFGSGRIGHVHAHNIAGHPDLDLAVIADPFLDGASRLAASTGTTAVASTEEALDTPGLDAVVIGSATSTHVELIEAAVQRGLAVVCEKPIDLDLATVRSCRERIAGSRTPIMLGFNRRFDPAFAAVRRRVEAGEIGTLEQLTIISRDPQPAPVGYLASSGGIFRDMTIHDLDMARFFVPDIVEVSAQGSTLFSDDIRDLGDYDTAVVTLRGARGELVTITNSRHCAFGYDQRLEAFGSAGMLSAANLAADTVRFYSASGTEQAGPYLPFFLERYQAAYRAELDAFAAAVRTGTAPSPGFDDGMAALVLAEAATESAAAGKAVNVEGSW